MGKPGQERTVIVSLWSAGSCGRKQLAGILRYINAGHPWDIRIIMDPKDLTSGMIARAKADGVDGLIAFVSPDAAPALAATDVPTVLLSFPVPALTRRKRNLAIFMNDNEEIGRKGADYLLSLGTFASYAFVPDASGRGWSRLRESGYRQRLAEAGQTCRIHRPERDELSAWLAALPKPAAVMTPFDFRAKEVVEACRRARLAMPKDVSVLGVDDDELICETTHPSISSIRIDQEKIGYRAAEALNRLMSARAPQATRQVQMASGRVIERESTRPTAPAVHLVRKIEAFIDAHFADELSVNDIAGAVGVSRRLADLRFAELTGRTIRRALEDRRLREVQRRLAETDLPIAKVTRLCGYQNDLWVKYVFRRRFGISMSEWRARGRRH